MIMKWKTGDTITNTKLSNFNTGSSITEKLKIISIDNNKFSYEMFTGYNSLAKFYTYTNDENDTFTCNKNCDSSNGSLINETVSKRNIYPNAKLLNDIPNSLNWNFGSLPFYYKNEDLNYTNLEQFISLSKGNNNLLSNSSILLSFNYKIDDRKPLFIPQMNNLIIELNKYISLIQWIQMAISIVMISLLLLVCVSTILEENKRTILIFKSLGFNNSKINWLITGNYLIGIILGYALSIVIAISLLKFIEHLLFKLHGTILELNLTLTSAVEMFFITFIIVSFEWILCTNKINRKKPTEIMDE